MSLQSKLENLKESSKITINDKFIGDSGASQLAHFLNSHKRVLSLEIKSNDISAQGFIEIFEALLNNPDLKQLNLEHNNLGANDFVQWHDYLNDLLRSSVKLERLNISNNKITGQGFSKLFNGIVWSKSLKMLQIRYNSIGPDPIEQFVSQLKKSNNDTLLYVQLTGNKVKKATLDSLQSILSNNRKKNPISKQKIMGITNYNQTSVMEDKGRNLRRNHTVDQISQDNIMIYLEDILEQNRRESVQNKIRLQNQLSELQKNQKIDFADLNELQKKCGEMVIMNRNLKFQLDRTLGEYQQLQRDQQSHLRVHEQKVRQTSKQIQDLQTKYQDMENRMNKEHEIKMKQIVRDWEARLRNVEEKIRITENDNNILQGQIKKSLEKRERCRIQCIQEENLVRNRHEELQLTKFNFKIKDLESKLRRIQDNRDGYINRNQQLIFELEKSEADNKKQIAQLQQQLTLLKSKQMQFNAKSKDFFTKNQKIKAEIQMRQITIDKLEDQIGRLDKQIQSKRLSQAQQMQKLKYSFELTKTGRAENKKNRLEKLAQCENSLRLAQLESAKLRQQYALLAQKLQISISLAVHKVFQDNSLF